jgi:hypothetical protein
MPKALLRFSLPEEQEEFDTACRGAAFKYALSQLNEFLRQQVKYCDHPQAVEAAYQNVRDELLRLLLEHDITLD